MYVTSVTDAGLASLAKVQPKLRRLDLGVVRKITGAGLAHLAKLPKLQDLVLQGPGLDDAAAAAIAKLPLRRLSLRRTAITDAGLEHLAGMRHLEHIDLSDSRGVTDRGVAALAECKTLRSINVRGARGVTDETLQKLSDLPLESIDLTSYGNRQSRMHAMFTDEGLKALAANPTLKRVVLMGAPLITKAGIAHLRIATTTREVIAPRRD